MPESRERPSLSPRQRVMELRVRALANPRYHGRSWWDKTKEFSAVWDLLRRKRLGILHTAFPGFEPRWEHPDWPHFLKGRRQADAKGAEYEQWMNVQFKRVAGDGWGELHPRDLHGPEAMRAFACATGELGGLQCLLPGDAPFDKRLVDLADPAHRRYLQGLVDELASYAQYVCPLDDGRRTDVLAQAICNTGLAEEIARARPELQGAIRRHQQHPAAQII